MIRSYLTDHTCNRLIFQYQPTPTCKIKSCSNCGDIEDLSWFYSTPGKDKWFRKMNVKRNSSTAVDVFWSCIGRHQNDDTWSTPVFSKRHACKRQVCTPWNKQHLDTFCTEGCDALGDFIILMDTRVHKDGRHTTYLRGPFDFYEGTSGGTIVISITLNYSISDIVATNYYNVEKVYIVCV